MSRRKQRQPHELLSRLRYHLAMTAVVAVGGGFGMGPGRLHRAAAQAHTLINNLLLTTPPDPPKRPGYYGAKGSLRNPHH